MRRKDMPSRNVTRRELLRGGILATTFAGAMNGKPAWAQRAPKAATGRGLPEPRPLDIAPDVLVAGGGPSGIGAAVGAAKAGASVLLIEQYGFLGGMATAGMVNPFMNFFATEKQLIKGVFQEMLARLTRMGGYGLPGMATHAFDHELFKIAADQIMLDHGVRVLFHSFVCGAEVQDDRIREVILVGKSGPLSVKAKVFVDTTGDADIAALSGAPWEFGRKEDCLVQPLTTNFNVAGVDEKRMPPEKEITALYIKAKADGRIKNPREDVLLFRTTRPGEIHFNTTRITHIDATNVLDFTKAELEGRRQVWETFNFLKKEVPGFENSYIISIGPQVGVRETRRIVGDYVLTEEDVLGAKKFDDGIALNNYPVDIHNPAGTGTVLKHLKPGEFYSIPYRCLTPKKIENLIVGGRPISTTHEAHSSSRVMPIACATGHACGVAAALAVKGDGVFRNVDVKALQKVLVEHGAVLS
jgi:hypothetical protein